jgi:S-ribosylhomocysteine lyase
MPVVESFTLDHTKVKAPYVRVAGYERHRLGSVVQKFDLRFLQPNVDAIPTAALHTLEHLLAFGLREELEGVIDISPMGCRTGFYLILWDEHDPKHIAAALTRVLQRVLTATDACGHAACLRQLSRSLAVLRQEYAKLVLEAGISDDPFRE